MIPCWAVQRFLNILITIKRLNLSKNWISQKTLTPVKHGQTVHPLARFEIKEAVDHAGLLVLPKPSQIGKLSDFESYFMVNFRTCIHSNGAVTADLSSEDLLSCCGYVCGNGCNGGFPQAAWEYWVQNGLVTGGLYGGEGCQPYVIEPCEHHTDGDRPACTGEEGTTPRCVHHCQDSYGVDFIQDKHYGSTAYR